MTTMTNEPFSITANPNVQSLMIKVMIAALPAFILHLILFGMGILVQWCLALVTLLLVESTLLWLRNRPIKPYITDLSGVITITALVFCIPPGAPWWIIVTGTAFALVFGKHLYGGLGYNPFNPAMLGYAFLLISFPVQMTQWLIPAEFSNIDIDLTHALQLIFYGQIPGVSLDMITSATPLNSLQTAIFQGIAVQETLHPVTGNSIRNSQFLWGLTSWEWINIAFLIGGLWLLYTRAIRWQYPVGFLLALGFMALFFNQLDPSRYPPVEFVLLSGGSMLAAFFIVTDPVTSSTTPKGRFIFAFGIGVLVYVIRTWGAFPDGIAFAVLLMNLCVPLIDQYTQPRVYGHSPRKRGIK